jgi:predicted transcriptional regulator
MSTDPLYVEKDTFLTKARQLIRDNHLRSLPVLDQEEHVIGMLTSQDVLRIYSTRSNVTVAGFMVEVPLITDDMNVPDTAKLMLAEKCEVLPVVQSKDIPALKGVISLIDIFKNIDPEDLPDRKVKEIMSTKIVTCGPKDPITKVWNKMLEKDYTGLPVLTDEGSPLGMITRFDILKRGGARKGKGDRARSHDAMRVESLMSTPLHFVSIEDDLRSAVEIMLRHDVGRISVVDEGKLVGIVDRYDLIKNYLGE